MRPLDEIRTSFAAGRVHGRVQRLYILSEEGCYSDRRPSDRASLARVREQGGYTVQATLKSGSTEEVWRGRTAEEARAQLGRAGCIERDDGWYPDRKAVPPAILAVLVGVFDLAWRPDDDPMTGRDEGDLFVAELIPGVQVWVGVDRNFGRWGGAIVGLVGDDNRDARPAGSLEELADVLAGLRRRGEERVAAILEGLRRANPSP